MKTYPDFTWEYVVQTCLWFCSDDHRYLHEVGGFDPERWANIVQSAQGTIAIVAKLREHPEMQKFVPMLSLLELRWFPSEEREIWVYCIENKVSYNIRIFRAENGMLTGEELETKTVGFDEVADEIYAYILKFDTP